MSGQFSHTEISALSIIGKKRKYNEDNFCINHNCMAQRETKITAEPIYVSEDIQLFGVFDGMGGENAGDLAAYITASEHIKIFELFKASDMSQAEVNTLYNACINDINKRIVHTSRSHGAIKIGCTLATLLLYKGWAFPFFLGDSRIYHFRNGVLKRVSKDHTEAEFLVELGLLSKALIKAHSGYSKLFRFLGRNEENLVVEADVHEPFRVMVDDIFFICSDGISMYFEDDEIAEILSTENAIEAKLNSIVDCGLFRGGQDNMTGLMVKIL